MKNSMADFIT